MGSASVNVDGGELGVGVSGGRCPVSGARTGGRGGGLGGRIHFGGDPTFPVAGRSQQRADLRRGSDGDHRRSSTREQLSVLLRLAGDLDALIR